MANISRINGFIPVGSLTGAENNLKEMTCAFAAGEGTATFIGDLVLFTGTCDATGVPFVKQAAATDVGLAGAVVSFDVDGSKLEQTYRTANQVRYCKVNVDPNTIFEVQANAALALTDMGMRFKPVVGSGNTTLGTSAMQLDASSKATTSTYPLTVIKYQPDTTPAALYNRVLVKINSHYFGSLGTLGIQGS